MMKENIQYVYENENARLIAEPLLKYFTNFCSDTEITEDIAMTMYYAIHKHKYYVNRNNMICIPILKMKVS